MKNVSLLFAGLLMSVFSFSATHILEVEVIDGIHSVVKSWTVEGDFAQITKEPSDESLQVTLWRDDFKLETIYVVNTSRVRAPLLQDGTEITHKEYELHSSLYHLRIPVIDGVTHVTVSPYDAVLRSLNGKLDRSLLLEHQF